MKTYPIVVGIHRAARVDENQVEEDALDETLRRANRNVPSLQNATPGAKTSKENRNDCHNTTIATFCRPVDDLAQT